MTRNLKALGLALIAVLAMSALVASAASAHTPAKFTVGKEKSEIVGEETVKNNFKVTGVETTCEEVNFTGTTPAGTVEAETQTITPSYKKCTAESIFGTIEVTVTGFAAGECDYRLNANETADLECAAGKEVTVDAATCTIHVPPQKGLGKITFTTGLTEGRHDLTVHVELTKVKTNHTDGFGCPLPSGGESVEATLSGTTTVSATNPPGVKVDLTWDATVA